MHEAAMALDELLLSPQKGAREQLIGLVSARTPEAPPLSAIAAAWRRRWLLNRIQSDDVLDRVGQMGSESVRASLWTDDDGQYPLPLE